ncbi:MAG: hypothetical protein M3R15_27830 [Acidobacteriota bacterium]|nr:hypothetical protein [Acidobacteriota bacterium]
MRISPRSVSAIVMCAWLSLLLSAHAMAGNDFVSAPSIKPKPNAPPVPSPLIGLPKSVKAMPAVSRAYMDAIKVLEEDSECSRFFGGTEVATGVLNKMAARLTVASLDSPMVGIRMQGDIGHVTNFRTGHSYRLFEKVVVNSYGPFANLFDRGRTFAGSYPASSRRGRALMLLHELAHLMKGPDGEWLIPDDGGGRNPMLSLRNTETIERVCRGRMKFI